MKKNITRFQNIWTLAKKEFNTLFHSYTVFCGYALMLCVCAYVCWFSEFNFFNTEQASLIPMFDMLNISFLFVLPALTMQSVADERKQGTLELMLTKPLTITEFVIGKYLSQSLLMIFVALTTVPYVVTLVYLGNVDLRSVVLGYIGVMMVGMCYLSISIFASSVAKTSLMALFIACLICVSFYFLFQNINQMLYVDTFFSKLLLYLSVEYHYTFFSRGIINISSIVYLLTVTMFFICLSIKTIERYKIYK